MKKIILIAGPSGAGKTTISEYLQRKFNLPRVVTHTTRPKREGEVDRVSYYFEDDQSFQKLHFFEHVKYGKYQYGSSKEALKRAWEKSDLVSLIVDIQGAQSYLKQLKDQAYFLYVTTSSIDELRKRLLLRGDDPQIVKERLSGRELNLLPENLKTIAHVLKNDDWQETTQKLDDIVSRLTEQ